MSRLAFYFKVIERLVSLSLRDHFQVILELGENHSGSFNTVSLGQF